MKNKSLIISFLMLLCIVSLFACKKKEKANWHEVDAPEVPKVEHFGIQTTKGTESNPTHIYVAPIYVPTGRDENGKSQFDTVMYEMEELTPEGLNQALIDCGVLTEDVMFVDFIMEKSNEVAEMGPGAAGKKKDMEGTVRYIDYESMLENADDYIDESTGEYYKDKRIKGMINSEDILAAILDTFEENYQLVTCWYQPANMDDYKKAHNQ